jgi:hypothetical protein
MRTTVFACTKAGNKVLNTKKNTTRMNRLKRFKNLLNQVF